MLITRGAGNSKRRTKTEATARHSASVCTPSPVSRLAAVSIAAVSEGNIGGPEIGEGDGRVQFTNAYNTGNFYLGLIGSKNPLDVRLLGTLGFVLPGSLTHAPFHLAEAWNEKNGAIVLLGAPAADPRALAAAIEKTLLTKADVRLVWIANPNAAPSDWICAAFRLGKGADTRPLQQTVDMAITGEPEGYRFRFDKGLGIGIDAVADKLLLTGGSALFGRGHAMFAADAAGMTIDLAPLAGSTFAFGFAVPAGDALVEGLDALGVGLWYSRPDSDGGRAAFRYPFFQSNPKHEALAFRARITPTALLDATVSRIDADFQGKSMPYYGTWLRTVFGRAVLAKPDEKGFALLFNPTHPGGFGLSPEGHFFLGFSNSSVDEKEATTEASLDRAIVCGSSGTESIDVPAALEPTLMLELKAGYPSATRAGYDALSLASDTTTAWLRISALGDLPYYAQPAGQAAMYLAAQTPDPKIPLMPYLSLQAATIPAGADAPLLPMVPLAGLTDPSRDAAIALETAAIGPARKAQLGVSSKQGVPAPVHRLLPLGLKSEAGKQVGDDVKFTAITPRGLEAGFTRTEHGDSWDTVQIARLRAVLPGNSGNLRFAGANGIVDPLLAALLTSQQFLVVSNPAAIKPFFSGDDAKITLAGWEFLLDPDTWAKHGTILILKNTPVALQALLGDLGAWTSANQFNQSSGATSRELLRIAAEARKALEAGREQLAAITGEPEDEAEQDLRFFVETVLDSPEWNGFLFLSAGLGAIPADLAGLRAGVSPERLYVHHLGVTQTPFTTLTELENRSSSLFGLIRYEDKYRAGDGLAYGFLVRELGVRFADSDIRDFSATVELSFGPVFGQRAVLADSEPVGLPAVAQMVGARHRRGDGDSYTFTAVKPPIRLMLGNGPLRRVDFMQGEFVTVSIAPTPDGWTRTVFKFAGALVFDAVTSGDEVYDVLSFDQLAFSDLSVRMEFRNDQPQKPVFTFSIEGLQLSEAMSTARAGSLYEGMPLKLGALIEGTAKPDSLGNMNVQLPKPSAALPARWYGITQVLDMGTLSDVAGAAALEARLLTAWGPGPGQFYVGLKISGLGLSGSASELSLLGVLKLTVYSLALRHSGGQWTLLMHGMTLGVFGKTLPPGGVFEFYVFGIPDPSGSANSLGWYGAWIADEKKPTSEDELLPTSLAAPGGLPIIPSSPRLRFRLPSPSHPVSKGD